VEREPITGVWGQSPQRDPGAEPLVGGQPPEAESFLALEGQTKPQNSPSFFLQSVHSEIRKGSPKARALNQSGVGKIRNFQPISHRISETVQDRTNILMTNRKSHTPFRVKIDDLG